jgi:hypothetical protein
MAGHLSLGSYGKKNKASEAAACGAALMFSFLQSAKTANFGFCKA